MRYNRPGRTGLSVSELCPGTMTLGGNDGIWQHTGDSQQADAERLIGRVLDAGINLVDTAGVYASGVAEQLTGQALKNLKVSRDSMIVATKVFGQIGDSMNARGASRFRIMNGIKASLKRMQLDHIGPYQTHGFDPAAPIEEIVHALDTLVQHGHVRYVGVSNWAAWQTVKALGIAERLGCTCFESLQAYYIVADRDLERELVPMLKNGGLGLTMWSPLTSGLSNGKYTHEQYGEQDSHRNKFDFPPMDRARAYAYVGAMRVVANTRSVSVVQIALAWLLHQQAVTTVIIGVKKIEQLDDNIAATKVELMVEELAQPDKLSKLLAEYPGRMLERQGEYRRGQFAGMWQVVRQSTGSNHSPLNTRCGLPRSTL